MNIYKPSLAFMVVACIALGALAEEPKIPFKFAGSCGEEIQATLTEGKITYYAQGPNVRIVDKSIPDKPEEIGVLTFDLEVSDIAIVGPALYVAVCRPDDCSIRVIDVSDPHQPVPKTTFTANYDEELFFEVHGTVLWVTAGSHHRGLFRAYDITVPLQPRELSWESSRRTTGEDLSVGHYFYHVTMDEIHVRDTSQPESPKDISLFKLPGYEEEIISHGTALYVVTIQKDGVAALQVVDASDPAQLRLVHTFPIGIKTGSEFFLLPIIHSTLWVWGSFGNVCPVFEAAYDISDPLNPVLKLAAPHTQADDAGTTQTTPHDDAPKSWFCDSSYIEDMETSGSIAYLIDLHQGLKIVDFSDPQRCRLLGSLGIGGKITRVDKTRNLIILGTEGPWAPSYPFVDVSNPTSPSLRVYTFATEHQQPSANDVLYLADGPNGLLTIDFSEPLQPKVLHTLKTSGECTDVLLSGSYGYVAAGHIQILDIADLTSPTVVVADLDVGIDVHHLLKNNHTLIALSRGDNEYPEKLSPISIIDISNPRSPKVLLRAYDMDESELTSAMDNLGMVEVERDYATIDGPLIYAPCGGHGGTYGHSSGGFVCVYDIGVPTNPRLVSLIRPPYGPGHLFLRGDTMFVSGARGGLMIYRRESSTAD